MPDPHACARMLPVDALSKEWRDLANEYGSNLALAMLDGGCSVEKAAEILAARRQRRQAEWFATDFHIDRDRFLKLARGGASRTRPLHARSKRRRRPISGVREDSHYA